MILNSRFSLIELFDDNANSLGQFDRLVVTAPTAQTAELLEEFPELTKQISQIEMNPCWATMVAFEEPITDQWVGAFLHGSFLSWAARNSTKPGRYANAEHLVIQQILNRLPNIGSRIPPKSLIEQLGTTRTVQ